MTVLALLVGITTMTPLLPPLPPRAPLFPASTRFSTGPDTAVARWVRDHPRDARAAAITEHISSRPQASWFPDPDPATTGKQVRKAVAAARLQGAVPVLVPYAVPRRDCAGPGTGTAGLTAYRQWIDAFARAIGPATAVVVLEPDSLALMDCLTSRERLDRIAALTYAGRTLSRDAPNAHLYYDAGHSRWHPALTIADRLRQAGALRYGDGIALNVSNFNATGDEARYGLQVIRDLGAPDLGMVIDTSRNGAGPARGTPYCDPPGRRLGHTPTAGTGLERVDAYLWVKPPGEADGCAAAPGTFDPQYAYLLAVE
ncbi:glycoside hydrolase family 6 protein [Streptomyces sp. NPDC051172]|uniref:glycoside hydrolase family 6 protein n=1 Tax=Streptomyces sp. NPDC051172 TaxID=3155796 RepID=UPI00342D4724